MRSHSVTAAERRRAAAAALVLFGAVFGLRIVISDPGELVGLLFVVPIALVAIEFGGVGGLVSAALASVAVLVWAIASGAEVSPLGYVTRLVTFFLLGGLVGHLSEQRARVSDESERWFEMSNDMLATASLDGYFRRLNSSWERCLGYNAQELMSRPYADLVHPDDLQATLSAGATLAAGPSEVVNFENRYQARSGQWRWLLWSARSDGKQVYAVAKDITERKWLELEHAELLALAEAVARTDQLTGLPNRRAWDEELQREVARARRKQERLAVVMLDIDQLKELNDSQGHQAGDALLREAATNWRLALRITDFVARYGGDEFGILLPNCRLDYADAVLERIRSATPHSYGCSAGIAYLGGRETAEALVARADRALYTAKQTGRNRSVTATGALPAAGNET